MTREEMLEKLDKLETRRFYLNAKSGWTDNDYINSARLAMEIAQLKKEIAKM